MTVEMLQTVSLICFGIAGLFLLIAAALFFILDVPALMGEATGATERKAIASIRSQNEETGNMRSAKSSKAAKSSTQRRRKEGSGVGTAKLSTEQLRGASSKETDNATTVLSQSDSETTLLDQSDSETTVLSQSDSETTVLSQSDSETTVLSQSDSETTVLSQSDSETTVLSQPTNATPILDMPESETTGELLMPADANQSAGFTVEVEFEYASSTEIIE